MSSDKEELAPFVGKNVVLDARGEYVYIGVLKSIGDWFFELVEVDVHDILASRSGKEIYLIEAAKYGIKKNRRSVMVKKSEVVSLSLLDEVIKY